MTPLDAEGAEQLLGRGEVTLEGRMPYSSNATFLARVELDGTDALAIYKPLRGERPLWDYGPGLYRREIAAYRLSEALGWGLVPATVGRGDDTPFGEGSLQLFVDADFEQHYFTLLQDESSHDALRTICAFDVVINSGDRKSGHCLIDADGHIWGVDNGLSFHAEPKLRTVIWDFGGDPVAPAVLADLERTLCAGVPTEVAELLTTAERGAVVERVARLLRTGRFPVDPSGRRYPWPLV
jgi:uncharacterized repeat protein (TIGR03843 family)